MYLKKTLFLPQTVYFHFILFPRQLLKALVDVELTTVMCNLGSYCEKLHAESDFE